MASTELDRNMGAEDSFIFTRGSIERRIRKSQITQQRLAAMFELDPSSLYIVEDFGETAEWPNNEGRFNMSTFASGTMLRVEGRTVSSLNNNSLQPVNVQSTSAIQSNSVAQCSTPSFSPLFRSVAPLAAKRKNAATIKVALAEKAGNKVLNPTRQTYLVIDDNSANVNYIECLCKQEFEDNTLVLVTGNGLRIEDCEATRGVSFWKATSRKIYAVPEGKGKLLKRKRYDYSLNSDDDLVEDFPSTSGISTPAHQEQQHDIIKSLKEILPDIIQTSVKEAVKEAYQLGPQQRDVFQELISGFICAICRSVIKPDIMFASCCKTIVGCRECVDTWYENNETCPKCRDIRGFEKAYCLRGFDDVLIKVNDLPELMEPN